MTFRESDDRIVPLKSGLQRDGTKPSNIGGVKAIRPLHDPDRASTVLRDGPTVITRLVQIHQRAVMQKRLIRSGWEPDALTAHVLIYDGATSIMHGDNIVTPPRETRWQTGKTNHILNTRE